MEQRLLTAQAAPMRSNQDMMPGSTGTHQRSLMSSMGFGVNMANTAMNTNQFATKK